MKPWQSLLVLLVALVVAPTAGWSGDFAQLRILGFSPDAKVFAFEEFGVQDGSGFPYSNIYFIDTVKDAYLPGTPYRVIIDDETDDLTPVSVARRKSLDAAAALLQTHKIEEHPGVIAAFNPVSEVNVPEDRLSYYSAQIIPRFGEPYTLQLETVAFPIPEKCKDLTENYHGFALRFTQEDGSPVDSLVYQDESVPASRGCVRSYRLGAVVLTETHPGLHMALIEVQTFGFEGNDGRWIAVPAWLN